MKLLSPAMQKALVAMGERVWLAFPSDPMKFWMARGTGDAFTNKTMLVLSKCGLMKIEVVSNSRAWWHEAHITDAGRKMVEEMEGKRNDITGDLHKST